MHIAFHPSHTAPLCPPCLSWHRPLEQSEPKIERGKSKAKQFLFSNQPHWGQHWSGGPSAVCSCSSNHNDIEMRLFAPDRETRALIVMATAHFCVNTER